MFYLNFFFFFFFLGTAQDLIKKILYINFEFRYFVFAFNIK